MITWFEKHSYLAWIVVIIIAIAIFYISTLTFPPSPTLVSWESFVYHFFAFFFLAFFLSIALVKGKKYRIVVLVILIAVLYGISDEIHQIFVPGRVCCIEDVLTNSAGIFLASLFYCSYCLKRKKQLLQSKNPSDN